MIDKYLYQSRSSIEVVTDFYRHGDTFELASGQLMKIYKENNGFEVKFIEHEDWEYVYQYSDIEPAQLNLTYHQVVLLLAFMMEESYDSTRFDLDSKEIRFTLGYRETDSGNYDESVRFFRLLDLLEPHPDMESPLREILRSVQHDCEWIENHL